MRRSSKGGDTETAPPVVTEEAAEAGRMEVILRNSANNAEHQRRSYTVLPRKVNKSLDSLKFSAWPTNNIPPGFITR